MRSTTALDESWSRSTTATAAPASESARHAPAPIPEPPPVTRATLSVSLPPIRAPPCRIARWLRQSWGGHNWAEDVEVDDGLEWDPSADGGGASGFEPWEWDAGVCAGGFGGSGLLGDALRGRQ